MALTRSQLAAIVHRRLGRLADDAGLTTTAAQGQMEGSYTDAIDAALRSLGAASIDDVATAHVNALIALVEAEMLSRLERHYALETDYQQGALSQKLSQIRAGIQSIREAVAADVTTRASGAGRGITIKRGPAVDYTAGGGDA
jgi:hypothetical protein